MSVDARGDVAPNEFLGFEVDAHDVTLGQLIYVEQAVWGLIREVTSEVAQVPRDAVKMVVESVRSGSPITYTLRPEADGKVSPGAIHEAAAVLTRRRARARCWRNSTRRLHRRSPRTRARPVACPRRSRSGRSLLCRRHRWCGATSRNASRPTSPPFLRRTSSKRWGRLRVAWKPSTSTKGASSTCTKTCGT